MPHALCLPPKHILVQRTLAAAVLSAFAVSSLAIFPTPAQAAFPGYNGKIVFHSNRVGNYAIYSMDQDGTNLTRLTTNSTDDVDPSVSPDGQTIAFRSLRDGNPEIYTMKFDGSGQTRLTNNPADDIHPTWSPDGSKIAFSSRRDGNRAIYSMNKNGSGQTRVTNSAQDDVFPSWSPDGSKIAFRRTQGDTDILVISPDGTGEQILTANTEFDDTPTWSPDGSKIAYTNNAAAGNNDIYVMNADGSGKTRLTTNVGVDTEPSWSPSGDKIVYRSNGSGNYEIMIMNSDGTDQQQLTSDSSDDEGAEWQPIPNQAPVAQADAVTTPFNTAASAAVLTNDTDEKALTGGNLTISVHPTHGAASVDAASGKISYTPTTGYSGSDQLTYKICDSFMLDQKCATAVLGITIQAPTLTPSPTPPPTPPSLTLATIGTLKTVSGATVYHYTGHRPTFTGATAPGATVTVTIHSEPIVLSTVADGAGSWSVTPEQDLPNGDHTVIVSATKDDVTTTLANLTLGINTGLAETGMPLWPLPLVGVLVLGACRFALRRHAA